MTADAPVGSARREKFEDGKRKKPKRFFVSAILNNWRLPTLAEPIGLLPSAMLRLTAEFGMGSGRTTALWPPKSWQTATAVWPQGTQRFCAARLFKIERSSPKLIRRFSENYTQTFRANLLFASLKSQFNQPKLKEKAIKPHDRLVSVR